MKYAKAILLSIAVGVLLDILLKLTTAVVTQFRTSPPLMPHAA